MFDLKKFCIFVLAVFFCGSASAVTITAADVTPCVGQSTCSFDGVTVSALPDPDASLAVQTNFPGVPGIGVSYAEIGFDFVRPNIQGVPYLGKTEALEISFDEKQYIELIEIQYLVNTEGFPTDPQEIAYITAVGSNGSATIELQSLSDVGGLGTGFAVNDPTLFSSLERLDVSIGKYRFTDPFALLGGISLLRFEAPDTPVPPLQPGWEPDNSDFVVALIETTPVPIPAGLPLLAGALGLIAVSSRFRRTSAKRLGHCDILMSNAKPDI